MVQKDCKLVVMFFHLLIDYYVLLVNKILLIRIIGKSTGTGGMYKSNVYA